MRQTSNMIFCGVFLLAGLSLLIGGLIAGYKTLQFIKSSISVSGEVIALRSGKFHPTIKFTTAEGEAVEYFQNGIIKGYDVGEKVTVLYDPQKVKEASVDSFIALWGVTIALLIGGLIFCIISVYKFLNPNSQSIEWNF